jgi:hypothetical protein
VDEESGRIVLTIPKWPHFQQDHCHCLVVSKVFDSELISNHTLMIVEISQLIYIQLVVEICPI